MLYLITIFIIDIFGVKRARSTVHNWVHKDALQPDSGRSLDHVSVDETVIRSTMSNIAVWHRRSRDKRIASHEA